MLLNNKHSKTYNDILKGMNHQLGVITAKINDLPSALTRHISNVGMTTTTLPAAPAAPDAPADLHPFRSGPKFVVPPNSDPRIIRCQALTAKII